MEERKFSCDVFCVDSVELAEFDKLNFLTFKLWNDCLLTHKWRLSLLISLWNCMSLWMLSNEAVSTHPFSSQPKGNPPSHILQGSFTFTDLRGDKKVHSFWKVTPGRVGILLSAVDKEKPKGPFVLQPKMWSVPWHRHRQCWILPGLQSMLEKLEKRG